MFQTTNQIISINELGFTSNKGEISAARYIEVIAVQCGRYIAPSIVLLNVLTNLVPKCGYDHGIRFR